MSTAGVDVESLSRLADGTPYYGEIGVMAFDTSEIECSAICAASGFGRLADSM
jgi:hypothetical protein